MGRRAFLEAAITEDCPIGREDMVDGMKKLGLGAEIDGDTLKVSVDGDPVSEVAVRAVIRHLCKLVVDEDSVHRIDPDEEL